MPREKTRIQQGKRDLANALSAAKSGNFEPALNLSCRQYDVGTTSSRRVWHMEICGSADRYMIWLEAAFEQFRKVGRIQGGFTTCLQDSMTYWYLRAPKHPSWPERFRQMSEFPEMAEWAEEVNTKLQTSRLHLDPLVTIA